MITLDTILVLIIIGICELPKIIRNHKKNKITNDRLFGIYKDMLDEAERKANK